MLIYNVRKEVGGWQMSQVIFSSNAEEVRYFAKKLLEDGQEHSVQEIKDFVTSHSEHSQDFTIGMYAGALRSLVQNSNGRYITVKRGKYQRAKTETTKTDSCLKQNVVNILEDFCKQLEDACTINILNIDKKDLKIAQKTGELINFLREAENELENIE